MTFRFRLPNSILERCVSRTVAIGKNLLIVGKPGAGKTTLLAQLKRCFPQMTVVETEFSGNKLGGYAYSFHYGVYLATVASYCKMRATRKEPLTCISHVVLRRKDHDDDVFHSMIVLDNIEVKNKDHVVVSDAEIKGFGNPKLISTVSTHEAKKLGFGAGWRVYL